MIVYLGVMKKVLTTITILFYFVVSCGVVINLHYCMGSLQSFELYAVDSGECGKCGKCGMTMEEPNDCCKNEVKIIILQDDQNKGSVTFNLPAIESVSVSPSEFITAPYFNVSELLFHNVHSPPLINRQDAYLLNCVFLI